MNDHDLLVRLAEIEGGYYRNGSAGPNDVLPVLWNPLTDDAQAMALVKKYNMEIEINGWDGFKVTSWGAHCTFTGSMDYATDPSLNCAIVLAVVASKEGQTS